MRYIDFVDNSKAFNEAWRRGYPVKSNTTKIIFITKPTVLIPKPKDENDFIPHAPQVEWVENRTSKKYAFARWVGRLLRSDKILNLGRYKVTFCNCSECSPYKTVEINTYDGMGYQHEEDILAVYIDG